MISRILHKGLLIVAAVLALGLAAWGQCSNANVTGKYGFSGGGLDKNGLPISVLGYIKANGKGTFTGTETVSDNGTVVSNVPVTGTYTIKSDCTGSGTILPKGSKVAHYNLVVLSGGKILQSLVTDAPTVQTGTVQAEGKATCTLAGLKGNFGVEASGVFIGAGAVALDGLFMLDGKGNVSGTESGSIAGTIFSGRSISGTYTVASNCTGTMTVTVLGQTEHSSFVVTNGGKGLLLVETDATTVVSGFGQQ
jgi:hypothetical protein